MSHAGILLLLVGSSLSACVVAPHPTSASPEIAGTLTYRNTPVSGITVLLNVGQQKGNCSESISEVRTDADGFFAFQGTTSLSPGYVYMEDTSSLHEWNLCVETDGQRINIWRGESTTPMGVGIPVEQVRLSCEFAGRKPGEEDWCTPSWREIERTGRQADSVPSSGTTPEPTRPESAAPTQ